MSKYSGLFIDFFDLMATQNWKDEGIPTFPTNMEIPDNRGLEHVQFTILPREKGLNRHSTSGLVIFDIYTDLSFGPMRSAEIADKLDAYLANKTHGVTSGANLQLFESSLAPQGFDTVNKRLYRNSYTIPFKHFGVS
jgi:hypothetical protein